MANKIENFHSGSFYIKITSKPNGKWILMYQSFKDGVKSQRAVEEFIYINLGLTKDLSIEEAKTRVKRINKNRNLERKKILEAGERVLTMESRNATLFPQDDVDEFMKDLLKENDINGSSEQHLKKLISHFNFVQDMVSEKIKCEPAKYKDKSKDIYEHFQKEKVSVNYAERLLAMLNKWGKFVSKKYGAFYEPVLRPKGKIRTNIAKQQKTKQGKDSELGVRTKSLPMTIELLNTLKRKAPQEIYSWCFLSTFLGLRPTEVDSLGNKQFWKLGMDRATKVPFIEIYQTKLSGLDEEDKWKKIPILFSEQQECISIIKSGKFKRPHPKTLRKYLNGNYTLYAGRLAFADIMLDRGQSLENLSLWLGHKKIETTWKYYKDKNTVRYTPTDEIIELFKKTNSK